MPDIRYTFDPETMDWSEFVPHPCVYFGWWLCEIFGAVRHWMLRAERLDSPYNRY